MEPQAVGTNEMVSSLSLSAEATKLKAGADVEEDEGVLISAIVELTGADMTTEKTRLQPQGTFAS
jgi:hypothetical protein